MLEDNLENNFTIKLEAFDGPFDLLLDLIRQKKMDINDISLAEIAGNYITFVKENEFKLAEATSFLSVAATLMLIKSRSLLPKIIFEQEDELEIDELKKRLQVLKEIRRISREIKTNFRQNILYKKRFKQIREIKFRPDQSLNTDNFLQVIDSLISSMKIKAKTTAKKVQKQISLKEITEMIYCKVIKYFKINFDEVIISSDKKEKAASFLAILELFRNGKVDLVQNQAFGRIKIEKTEPSLIYKE